MGKSMKMVFFVLYFMVSQQSAIAEDMTVLIAFQRSSIESDPSGSLRNWDISGNSSSPCSWAGIDCSPEGSVVGLDFSNMGLIGSLRMDDLMVLPELRRVDLHGNFFYGNLSHTRDISSNTPCRFESVDLSYNNFSASVAGRFLSACDRLVELNLSNNAITGGVYPYVSSLQRLDLSSNRISDGGLLEYSLSKCGDLGYLNFSNNRLTGKLPDAYLCSNLTILDLSYNQFSGDLLPDFVSRVPLSMNQLILSHNNISGDLSGVGFGSCDAMTMLDFSYNALTGSGLPRSLANCRRLEFLDFSNNHLSNVVPSFLAKLGKLKYISLASNNFSGSVPPELGRLCGTLRELNLSSNSLTGGLPSTFKSCSGLETLDLSRNILSGDFVDAVVSTITSLKYLYLPFNNITGIVPLESLQNCTSLEVIDLSSNEFAGRIPEGFCNSLPSLREIFLSDNFLSGEVPLELAKCGNLRSIDFSFNDLNGAIPPDIFALPKLVNLVMWANNISGEISDNLCSTGGGLETLILNHNAITGSIPKSLTRCLNLIWVSLSGNHLTGAIPSGMGKLKNLAILQFGNNFLTGEVPPDLGNCSNLIWLDLNLNRLTGPVPPSLADQAGLIQPGIISGKEFAFLRNEGGTSCPGAGVIFEFAGIRPSRLASFPLVHACPTTRIYTGKTVYTFMSNGSMIYLDLSYNSLSGTLPETYGTMEYLQVLNLGHNRLTGDIPKAFAGMKSMGAMDLSHNHLTGILPGELGALPRLADLDVSNNNLTGPISTSGQLMTFPATRYENNSGLCGVPLPPCGSSTARREPDLSPGRRQSSTGSSMIIGITISVLVVALLLTILYKMKKSQKNKKEITATYADNLPTPGMSGWKISGVLEPLSINIATFEKPLRKLTFAHLLEATNGFSTESLIGSGGFGEVYKARLDDGSFVAVKKLMHVTGQGDREFTAEMETIGKIKHRNLVALLGYCKVGEERLLVYDYMKHGSLDVVLHDARKGALKLDWNARKKIAIGAARGLAFLHHSCIPHIIHRDMKSSNVLLDGNLEARVSDFGMARLMNALDTHLSVSTLAGTPGYVPPEYYQSFRCTTKGDVYSYGVVLLELLSGKRPIDPVEFGDNNLVGWVKQMVKDNQSCEVFDPELTGSKSGEAEMYRYLKIACECLDDRSLRRPTMIQVMAMFKELQIDTDVDVLDGLSIGGTTIDETREKTT